MIDIRHDVPGLWCDDITFCPKKCEWGQCPRNQKNIRDRTVPHSFSIDIPRDCPKLLEGGEVGMKCEDVYNKAKEVIGEENIDDYRPAIFSTEQDTFLDGVNAYVPNTIMVWLKNGDCVWYRAKEGR